MASEHHHEKPSARLVLSLASSSPRRRNALLAGKTDGAGMVREDTFQPGCCQSPDARPVNFKLSFEFSMMKWD
jgi:hypothetical protein